MPVFVSPKNSNEESSGVVHSNAVLAAFFAKTILAPPKLSAPSAIDLTYKFLNLSELVPIS